MGVAWELEPVPKHQLEILLSYITDSVSLVIFLDRQLNIAQIVYLFIYLFADYLEHLCFLLRNKLKQGFELVFDCCSSFC